ncbi:hypothetical protein AVEN_256003-1 [Araneus ventricosus]|uniref:ATP-dependent DNA helicase n=1 Tax=Araneus ventricosus TaxID=182803 RepID=A0A4Y2KUI3_ARAVE|nr:hypothetical protein AVEN_256003-1 [Araneus ventricosus]
MWRLLGSHIHDRSHAVMRLPVHLPNQKCVSFKDGHEEKALEAARLRQTMLESWFQLNQSHPDIQTLLNTNIPYNYVYDSNNWKRRKRGVSSMRSTSPEADKQRQAVLIIIDEITLLTKDGLRCIDSISRDLMNNDKPFGGKVIIIGGDFRQTLPVVPRGARAVVIES